MNEQNQTEKLLDKTVNIDPIGVIYNVMGSSIERFAFKYLEKAGIDGINAVTVAVKSEGIDRPFVQLFLFVSKNSTSLKSNAGSVPAALRHKMEETDVFLTDAAKKILSPLVSNGEIRISKVPGKGEGYMIELNIFKVLGVMFMASPSEHALTIHSAKRLDSGDESILAVIKQIRPEYKVRDNSGNKYHRYAMQASARR